VAAPELNADQIRAELGQNEAEQERLRSLIPDPFLGEEPLSDEALDALLAKLRALDERHQELMWLQNREVIDESCRTGRPAFGRGDEPMTLDNVTWGRTPAERAADAAYREGRGMQSRPSSRPAVRRVTPRARPRAHRPSGPRRARAPAKAGEPSEPPLDGDAALPPHQPPELRFVFPLEGRPRMYFWIFCEADRDRILAWINANERRAQLLLHLLDWLDEEQER
jgi:hypothetical protein